ncbi:MAG: hypothetical protein AAGI07_11275 [Bacteroidota bacterium]
MEEAIKLILTEMLGIPESWLPVVKAFFTLLGKILVGGLAFWKGFDWVYTKYSNRKISKDLHPYFTYDEVKKATQYYIATHVQNIPPTKEDEPSQTFAFVTSEKIIPFFLKKGFRFGKDAHRFYMILADSGMGKTTFMINLYVRYYAFFNWHKPYELLLMPFKHPKTIAKIKEVIEKGEERKTILLLDAFDEDEEAVKDYQKRLNEVMHLVQDFREVVITSRTQFF